MSPSNAPHTRRWRPASCATARSSTSTTLADVLRKMFAEHKLAKRVRIGVANQRIVMRTVDLPPLIDAKDLASAVRFQAQEHIPMPLDQAVLEHHSLGLVETADGPRTRVVLVAARRDMIDRLLEAARRAGLRPHGIDLSAFAMIRALHRPGRERRDALHQRRRDDQPRGRRAAPPACSPAWSPTAPSRWPASSPSAAA